MAAREWGAWRLALGHSLTMSQKTQILLERALEPVSALDPTMTPNGSHPAGRILI